MAVTSPSLHDMLLYSLDGDVRGNVSKRFHSGARIFKGLCFQAQKGYHHIKEGPKHNCFRFMLNLFPYNQPEHIFP